jgi:hypothetical protein
VVGVGHNEDPLALVRKSDVGSGHLESARSVAESEQVQPDPSEPTTLAARDVLDDDDRRAQLADDATELAPEPGSGSCEPRSFPGPADVLAREAPVEHIDQSESCPGSVSDIRDTPIRTGPMTSEYRAAVGIHFDLEHRLGLDAGLGERPVEAQI